MRHTNEKKIEMMISWGLHTLTQSLFSFAAQRWEAEHTASTGSIGLDVRKCNKC